MYGQYRNSGIVSIQSYAEAVKWHDNTPPIRGSGRNAGLRPLGHRNRMHFQILMDDEKNVRCRLYDTDVVVFRPDDTVFVTTDRYNTQTTANFISDVLRVPCGVHDHSVVVRLSGNDYRVGTGIVLGRKDKAWTAIEAKREYTYAINRKRMNELRKSVAAFRTYLSGSIKVRDGQLDPEMRDTFLREHLPKLGVPEGNAWSLRISQWREDAQITRIRLAKFVEMVQEGGAGNWYTASLWLMFSTNDSWRGSYARRIEVSAATSLLDEVLIALNPDALDVKEVPEGIVKRNKYAQFKPYKELTNG
jgi:hypothetical protein